ncbi:hypothetical protein SANT12839_072630 [Streptomyces antimycoticus]|uniref:Beta-ketoacyl synthase-like N-terminal domain-containing protein n=1 Tax=Streptomyces antimycoticus TaxID=68175 RepID=A0A4D4KB48_9ACTN|nr:hypothetical protein SANT12839_072630 [Streptomyces antimycoticus]
MNAAMDTRSRGAAITGIGVIAPNGVGTDAFWKATREGIPCLDRISREGSGHFPVRIGGQVRGFDPASMIEERFLVQTDRFTHFAMASADLALDDARLPVDDMSPFAIGVVTASGSGGGEFGQRELQQLYGKGPRYVGPYQSIAWFYAASTGQVSIRGGSRAPAEWWPTTRPAVWTRSRTPAGPSGAGRTRWWPAPPRHRWRRTPSSACSAGTS